MPDSIIGLNKNRIYNKILTKISLGIGSLNHWLGNSDFAIDLLKEALKKSPNNPVLNWKLGTIYLKISKPHQAIPYLMQAVHLEKENYEYLLWLTTAYEHTGEIGLAYNLVEKVISIKPDSEALCIKGKLLMKKGEEEEGLLCFEKSLELNPKNTIALNEKACYYLKNNSILEAIKNFNIALHIKPKDKNVLLNLALAYIKLQQYDQALSLLSKAKKLKLHSATLYNAIGICHSHLNNYKIAKENYLIGLKSAPDNMELLSNLATINVHLELYLESLALYDLAIKTNPYNEAFLNNIAWCLEKLNNKEEAIKYYYRALAIDVENHAFRMNLAECLFGAGYLQEAIDHLEILIKMDSKNFKAWNVLGRIYDEVKLYTKAVDCHNKALGLE